MWVPFLYTKCIAKDSVILRNEKKRKERSRKNDHFNCRDFRHNLIANIYRIERENGDVWHTLKYAMGNEKIILILSKEDESVNIFSHFLLNHCDRNIFMV